MNFNSCWIQAGQRQRSAHLSPFLFPWPGPCPRPRFTPPCRPPAIICRLSSPHPAPPRSQGAPRHPRRGRQAVEPGLQAPAGPPAPAHHAASAGHAWRGGRRRWEGVRSGPTRALFCHHASRGGAGGGASSGVKPGHAWVKPGHAWVKQCHAMPCVGQAMLSHAMPCHAKHARPLCSSTGACTVNAAPT
jgi:hypothetical protein